MTGDGDGNTFVGDVLAADGLRKTFGDLVAVDDVSVHIAPRETYGLLGPNGAGKTTAVAIIAGLLEPDAGRVVVDGRRVTTRTVGARAAIGLVPQELAVYPDLTGRENLVFFGRLYGLSGRALAARVAEVLELIGLTDRAGDLTGELPGGMRRRLNIGVGLLHRPKLLILDEPTVGVDPPARHAILESVENLAGAGMAVLYTTRHMDEAERVCDRVGLLDQGDVKAEGTRRELVALVGERDRISLNAPGSLDAAAAAVRRLDGVGPVSVRSGGLDVVADDASSVLPRLLSEVTATGVETTGVEVARPDLEAVFLHVTGKALRA